MSARRAAALALALAIPASSLNAAPVDCTLVRTLLSDKRSERAAFSIGWSREGARILHRGKPTTLPEFGSCELSGTSSRQSLECSWQAESREDALARVDLIRRDLASCLPQGWTDRGQRQSDVLAHLAQFEAAIETDERDTIFSLKAVEFFASENGPATFRVYLEYESAEL